MELPQSIDHSILIKKNEIPIVSAIKAAKTKTNYVCGNTINIDDLTVTYYDADSIEQELEAGDYTTNADKIDMSTEGVKTLVITYGEMTTTIELTVTDEESDVIASGEYKENGNDITWVIDADGKLTVEGTGDFAEANTYSNAPWYDQRMSIKSAVIKVTGMTDATNMFCGCSYLTDLDLNSFDTSQVIRMDRMFNDCSNLTSLDLSGFSTSKVTNMSYMFMGCSRLAELDLSSFDTSQVTDMYGMFWGCSNLTNLKLRSFDTGQVENIGYMFNGCSSLTNLDLSGFDTSQVKNVGYMFYECSSLTNLDLSNFDTSQVTTMWNMFYGCNSLTNLDVGSFNTSKVANMHSMFSGCSKLTSLDLGKFDTGQVTDMSYMFLGCGNLTSLNVSKFDTSQVINMGGLFSGCSNLVSLDVSKFDTSQVTNMDWMFSHCSKLTELNLSGLDTSQVTDMWGMFNNCSSLRELDLSGLDTSQVTDMRQMFNYCSNLTKLDLSGLDTSQVTDMWEMFNNCSSLRELDLSGLDTSRVTNMEAMFSECSNLTELDLSSFRTNQVLDMGFMLYGCSNLTKLNLSGFDTSQVVDMEGMFNHCNGLTELDLSGFKTSQVLNMSFMFYECNNLNSLDLSNFDVGKVTDMTSVFSKYGSGELQTIRTPCNLKLSVELPTGKWYKDDGTELTELPQNLEYSIWIKKDEVPTYSTLKATKTKTIYICGDTINVDDLTVLYYDDDGMTHKLDNDDYTTNVNEIEMSTAGKKTFIITYHNGGNVFTDEIKLIVVPEGIIASGEYKENDNNITWVIDADGKLTVEGKGDFSLSYAPDRAPWYNYRSEILSAEINVTDMTNATNMFYGCSNLTKLDLKDFDTSQVTNMRYMFYGCSNLSELDLSRFNTSQVTDMLGMFCLCYNLSSLDLSGFNTSQVTEMDFMFSTCSELTSLDVSKFDTSQVTSMKGMFLNCGNLINLDFSKFDTSQVIDMSIMLSGCGKLQTIRTPLNLKLSVELPAGSWYQADGTTLTELPQNLDHSIVIKKNEVPLISALKIGKTKINYMCGETINLDDLTVTYYDAGSTAHVLSGNEYTTNAGEIDMSTPEKKVLIITYNDGKSTLTGEIELTVVVPVESIMLSADTLSLKVGETAMLTATVTPDNAADKTVTWVSSDRTVVEVEDGVVEAIAAGECTITASSGGKSAICNVTVEYDATDLTVDVPVANPESGRQLTAGSKVTLTCETARAEIYYTTANSEKALTEPTEKSTRYTEPIIINRDMYIKAVAIKGDNRSKMVTLHYTVADAADRVLKPYAVPGQGAVEKGTKVELKSDTSDAAIYYITGKNADMLGAVPVDDAHKYTEPIEITKDMVIKAIAKKDSMKDSDFSIFVYKIKVTLTPPVAVPASGTVDRGDYISLNADSDTNIYYTMDQSNPTASGAARLYESKIRVDGDPGSTMVIKAVAEKNGAYSETVTFTYTVSENTVKGLQVMLAGSEEFTYTGSAITPAVIVTNNGEELTEGEDYTVRYSNNVKAADKNASKAPKITVTGKGNLTKSRSVTFSITPKDIGDEEEVVGGNIVVVQDKTASPVLFYGGVKLTAKDFVNPDAKKKYSQDETITVTGKGNFEGTRDIDVKVVNKEDLKKFTVAIDNGALKEEPLIYDGEAKTLDGYFEVFDTTDKSTPLEEYSDYAVIYPKNNINAGKVKFTVVGLGEYYGTVTKTYTIKPRVVKTDADGNMEVNVNDGVNYPFRNGGVIIPDLAVTCDGDALIPGKDYKVTYSNNKKTCTGNKAKCTISFTGNYKGSKALVRKFNITPAVLDDVDQINGLVSVAVGDMVYTGKPGAYKSIPYVTANGVLLKSADYKVSYYKDQDRKLVIDGKTASSSVNLADGDKQTVYVKIEGKGNYEGTLTAQYNIYRLAEGIIDLAKAKVSFVGGNKAEYTGEGVEPEIEVRYKSGRTWEKVDANDIGTYVTVTYINNVNKGKATVMINGNGGKYVGSKTVVFSIVPKSMK